MIHMKPTNHPMHVTTSQVWSSLSREAVGATGGVGAQAVAVCGGW